MRKRGASQVPLMMMNGGQNEMLMSTTKDPLGYGDNQLGRTGEGSVTNALVQGVNLRVQY